MAEGSGAKRPGLSRDRVLLAAVEVADAEGLAALSMRRLGRHLGVEAMSLYNHVDNKGDVLDGLIAYVLGEIDLPAPDDTWQEAVRRRAVSARAVFLRHPWAMGLMETRSAGSSPQRLGYYDTVLGSLRTAGFDIRSAIRAFSAVDAYIFGFILQELSLPFDDEEGLDEVGTDLLEQMAAAYPNLTDATRDTMASGWDYAVEFAAGLDLIIGALERRLDG